MFLGNKPIKLVIFLFHMHLLKMHLLLS